MNDINIIVCNNKIYFDGETIAEIRELTNDSDYSYYKSEIEVYETAINDGGYHNITELIKTIQSLCTSYEGDRDSEYLSLEDDEPTQPDHSPLTEKEERILDRIASIDNILKQVLEEAENNNDIPTLHELVNIYELMEAGVFTLEQAEKCVRKHLVNSRDISKTIGHANMSSTLKAYANKAEVKDM